MNENIETLLWELVELVKQAAPELWRMAITQAYVRGVMCMVVAVVALGVMAFFVRMAYKFYGRRRDFSDNEVFVFSVILALVCTAIFLYFGCCAIGRFINPEYYAINILIGLVK